MDELYNYVHERVVAEMPRQRPMHQSHVEGRIVLARNPRWELPEYLRHGLASPMASDRMNVSEGLKRLNRVGNALVRQRTAEEIRRLADDDSRQVSLTRSSMAGRNNTNSSARGILAGGAGGRCRTRECSGFCTVRAGSTNGPFRAIAGGAIQRASGTWRVAGRTGTP